MSAEAPRWRRPRLPDLTPTRLTAAVVVALVAVPALFAVPSNVGWGWFAYLTLVFATVATVRSTRREPGGWLGRRIVRRALVLAVAADCVALTGTDFATHSGAVTGGLLLLLGLNVLVGRATQRLATAPDEEVDERQEALRNRAHRLAYGVLAVAVGGTVVVSDVASSASRAWLQTALRGGAWWVLIELLFVLPALTLAWLEPERIAPEQAGGRDPRSRVATALLAVTVLIPFVLSLATVALPPRIQASVSQVDAPVQPVPEPGTAAAGSAPVSIGCREFTAAVRVGLGAGGDIPLHAAACWDGRSAYEDWGLNRSDCTPGSSVLALLPTQRCTRTTAPDGSLHFTYTATARPLLLPFLSRDVTVALILDRNGTVVRFP